MKIQLVSDLHLEMFDDFGRGCLKSIFPLAPVLVIAGDLAQLNNQTTLDLALSYFCENWDNVIYVLGNHEYYTSCPDLAGNVVQHFRKKFPRNLHVFSRPGSIKIGNCLFLCGTMWFPHEVSNPVYARYLNDFSYITDFVPWVYEQNAAFKALLNRKLEPGAVVVTHHLPSKRSVSPGYILSQLNRFFVSDMEELIFNSSPGFWLHGHTHNACDYFMERTRVVANPRGYFYEEAVKAFNPGLILEV